MMLLEFAMTPVGKGESFAEYVAPLVKIVEDSGLPFRLTPTGTILEGDWDDVMPVLRRCYQHMERGCPRFTCTISIDARKGASGRIDHEVARVEELVGHAVSH